MQRQKSQTAHLMASPDDVEAQFYEALRHGDIDKLMSVWADDDDVVCVHPGGPRSVGTLAIRSAFEAVFAGGRIPAHPEQVHKVHTVDSAMHSVLERVDLVTPEGPRTGWVIATNVYLRGPQGWRMVAHHASPGTADPVQDVSPPPSVLH